MQAKTSKFLVICFLIALLTFGSICSTKLNSKSSTSVSDSSSLDVLLLLDNTAYFSKPILENVFRNLTKVISTLKNFASDARIGLAITRDPLYIMGGTYTLEIVFPLTPIEEYTEPHKDFISFLLESIVVTAPDGNERWAGNGITEAILQTINCKEELGWDSNRRGIVYVLTRNNPVLANGTSMPTCLIKENLYYKENRTVHASPATLAESIRNSGLTALVIGTTNLNFGRWIPFTRIIPNAILLDAGFAGNKFLQVLRSSLDMVSRGENPLQNAVDCYGGVCDYDFWDTKVRHWFGVDW